MKITRQEKQWQIDTHEARIRELVSSLTAPSSPIGDWKIIKCYEAKLLENELPYNLEELIEQRQAVRAEINSIESQIEELEKVEVTE